MNGPKQLLESLGYQTSSPSVGLYIHRGNLMLVDRNGETRATPEATLTFLEILKGMGDPPSGVEIGSVARDANHWIVLDLVKCEWSVVPAPIAKNVVTGRPMTPGELEALKERAKLEEEPPMMRNYYAEKGPPLP